MNTMIKLLIGVVLLIGPLVMYAYELMNNMRGLFGLTLLRSLGIVLQGTIPPFIALIGLFIVWLELDEWRIEKELKKEEEEEAKQEKPKRRKKKK